MSDLHRGIFVSGKHLMEAVQKSNALAPHLVVLTGDYVTESAGKISSCAEELSRLKAPHGVLAVLGNHDHWTDWRVVKRGNARLYINRGGRGSSPPCLLPLSTRGSPV